MKLGNHTVGLRKRTTRLDGQGKPVRSAIGAVQVDVVDVKVRWCSVTPTTRTSETSEPENRTAPRTSGMTLLAPPATDLDAASIVIWPITSETEVDGVLTLSGPAYEVIGDPGLWDHAVEAELRKSS